MDPSAHSFEIELKRMGLPIIHAENDVLNGIYKMTAEMKAGNLFILENCKNTIKEIESYCWDSKESEKGNDKPIKKNDHLVDAIRYAVFSHQVSTYEPYKDVQRQKDYLSRRFG
jgi:phage terminase large subunit